jgi:hypothetical protein
MAIGRAHLTFLGERIETNDMSTNSPGPLLALGRTAEVYAWQDNQVLKLFYAWCRSTRELANPPDRVYDRGQDPLIAQWRLDEEQRR